MKLNAPDAKYRLVINEDMRLLLRAALLQGWRHGLELENGVAVPADDVVLLRGLLGDASPDQDEVNDFTK